MMPHPEKSEVRLAIEADVTAALAASERPLSVDDLYPLCESDDDKTTLARILSHMRSSGAIAEGGLIQPGEPGGMAGRGARAVKAWRLPSEVERCVIKDAEPLGAWADQADAEPAIRQGKSADAVAGQNKPSYSEQFAADKAAGTLRAPYPDRADAVAALRMMKAEEDDAEACLDDAGSSHNGDEFQMPISGHGELQIEDSDEEWTPDVARTLADLRCSRCDPVLGDDRAALLLHGAEELLITIARERLRGDPVWDLAHAHYQALMEVL